MKNFHKFLSIFLVLYAVFVGYICLFPLPDLEKVNPLFPLPIHLLPSDALWRGFFDENFSYEILQILGHIPLMMPFGFIVPIIFPKFQKFSFAVSLAIFIGFLTEMLQFLVGVFIGYNYRVVDVNDVILNFLGVMCGYTLFVIGKILIQKHNICFKKRNISK